MRSTNTIYFRKSANGIYFKILKYFDKRNKDGDPEGLDALVSCAAGLFWPLSVPIFVLCKLFSS
jgi:hypothetical protein